ncbi:MAG: hypothetical protein US60_C0005G0009 [Microgenomates group bacterium GW2011_GWC1_37_8]|uniref:NAD-dependent epimerase/dehydratase domain-containing protein n=2 Tax=Candidatus Woeseibacteriota TaxID=1752722 RepID=A0A0G0L5I2_9BACT|nr:MAG: hypothetical protein US60_C0005G0009 [Microgenomates group bacterium GW2011_GWC1_37_8]KKQ86292.1 MAG: hypothetical protein UT08_C0001G0158 [Candidatus Woesebacteria bacterium GW2011_GWB1_38_8]OGM22315.1 MAG: epimerase [Candidatus Woesebacteria bacterium RIFCSPHIGHO2_01_FULL_38_9b]
MSETVLVTGANGEVGHGLIPELNKSGNIVIALDVNDLDASLKTHVKDFLKSSVTDKSSIEKLFAKYKISTIFHLAAVLSTGAEKNPELATDVNAGGTTLLLSLANAISRKEKRVIKFIFPSTIAIYGLPDLDAKNKNAVVKEDQFQNPITIYGITKLYCEKLGSYFSTNYQLLSTNNQRYLDFRCVRFPGIISALTLPTGGTSDYAPEMIHSAAKGEGYECFVRPDTIIPFMVMPDAIKALLQLTKVPKESLKQLVYNIKAFSATADEISRIVNSAFPDSSISYNPDLNRQKIVDSWPAQIDDAKARSDWGWKPDYDIQKAFNNYLIPEIKNHYK